MTSQLSGMLLKDGKPGTSFTHQDLASGLVSFQIGEAAVSGGKAGFAFELTSGSLTTAQLLFMLPVGSVAQEEDIPSLNRGGAVPEVRGISEWKGLSNMHLRDC